MNKPNTRFLPVHGHCLATMTRDAETTSGGLFLPERSRRISNQGFVFALPIDAPPEYPLNIGDEIIWPEHNEYRLKDEEGTDFACVPISQIILICPTKTKS